MNANEWLAAYSEQIGVDAPGEQTLNEILDLAAEAAHASERIAAPVACWLAAGAGMSPAAALEAARAIGPGEEAG